MKTLLDYAAQQMILGNLEQDLQDLLNKKSDIGAAIDTARARIKAQKEIILDSENTNREPNF